MGVNVTGADAVRKKLAKLQRMDVPLNKATKRMIRGLKTDASNAIREDINWKKKYVDDGLSARSKYATESNPSSSVTVSAQSRGALLRNFTKGKVTKKGVMIEITKGRRKRIGRAFQITLKNGVQTVAWRKSKRSGRNNLALHGPSPSQILNTKQDEVKQKGEERFAKELNHEIGRHLNGS